MNKDAYDNLFKIREGNVKQMDVKWKKVLDRMDRTDARGYGDLIRQYI